MSSQYLVTIYNQAGAQVGWLWQGRTVALPPPTVLPSPLEATTHYAWLQALLYKLSTQPMLPPVEERHSWGVWGRTLRKSVGV